MQRARETDARRHHTLPQWYMLRFSAAGRRLYVFDRVLGKGRPDTPTNIAVERDFNTLLRKDGSRESWPESRLAELDDAAAKALDKLTRGEVLTREDRWSIAFFVGFADTRGPAFRRTLPTLGPEDLEGAHDFIDDRFTRAFAAMSGVWLDPKTIERLALEQASEISSGLGEIGGMIEAAFELAMRFFHMQWLVTAAPNGQEFVTSDRPLGVLRRDGFVAHDPLDHKAFRVFPISTTLALFISEGAATHDVEQVPVPSNVVRLTNLAIASRYDRYLIGSSQATVEATLADAKLAERLQMREA